MKPMSERRQQVLILYLANSALDSRVVSWAEYDGTGREHHFPGDRAEPPYATGLDALKAGWRLIQLSELRPAAPGAEHQVSYQRYECVFEKLVSLEPATDG